MRGFKALLRKYWKAWKIANTDANGQCERIGLSSVLNIISNAWRDVAPELAEKAFQVAGLVGEQNDKVGDLVLAEEEFDEQDDLVFDDDNEDN